MAAGSAGDLNAGAPGMGDLDEVPNMRQIVNGMLSDITRLQTQMAGMMGNSESDDDTPKMRVRAGQSAVESMTPRKPRIVSA